MKPPRNRFTGRSVLHLGATQFWADVTNQDSVPLSGTGDITADGYTQIGTGVSLRLSDLPGFTGVARRFNARGIRTRDVVLSMEWVNVTDETRVDSFGFPLPGRLWYLRLRSSFR